MSNIIKNIKCFFFGCKHINWVDEYVTKENETRGFVDQSSYCDRCFKYKRRTRKTNMQDKIENLIKEWERQRSDILTLLEKQKHNEQNNFKLTYKSLQLKYCIKDLRCILEDKCKNKPCYPNLKHGVLVCDNCDYSEV